jgi:hypothetical protein
LVAAFLVAAFFAAAFLVLLGGASSAGPWADLRATTARAAAPARLTRERRLEVAIAWDPIPVDGV